MLFKKKVPASEYCMQNLKLLFSKEREVTWEAPRQDCNDLQLSHVDANLYYNHLRAVFIQLMLVAIAKNCNLHACSDAHVFVMMYLKERNLTEIDQMGNGYNRAFGTPGSDGVRQMVVHFVDSLTGEGLNEGTVERLYVEFYSMLKLFFDDFKSLKLTPSR